MKKLSLLLLFVFLVLALSPIMPNPVSKANTAKTPPVQQPTMTNGSSSVSLNWTAGWDLFGTTFRAFPSSRIVYSLSSNRTVVEIQFVLNGTNLPNTSHSVGLTHFWPSTPSCFSSFGTITGGTVSSGSSANLGQLLADPGSCAAQTKQGITRIVSGFELGILSLDANGSGFLNVTISNVPLGTFQIEFFFRQGVPNLSIGCGGVPDPCPVLLQSPGPTFGVAGSTVFISTVTATSILAVGPPLNVPIGIALSKDGQQLFVSDYGANAVFAIPSAGGSPKLLAFGGPLVNMRGMTISPDGNTLYIAGFGTNTIISLPSAGGTPTVIASGSPFSNPHGITVSPDGSTLYVADANAGAVFSLSAAGGTPTTLASGTPFGTGFAGPDDLKVSPDGSTLFINSGPAGIFTLPTKGGTPTLIGTFPGLSQPFGVSLSSDGKKLYFLSIDNAFSGLPVQILVMPASGGKAIPLLSGPPIVHGGFMTLSHNDQVLYLADTGGLSNIPSEPGRVLSLTLPTSCCNPPTGLVSWWPGEGNANDIVGNNHGRLVNGASFAPGLVGQAFSFNGTNQYVDLGNSSSLQVSHGNFTVDAWVTFNTTSGDMSILDKMSGTGSNQDGWRLLRQSDNKFWFCFGGGSLGNGCGGGPPTIVTSMTTVSTGVWYNIVAVKALSTISIYMDGNLEGTAALGPFIDSNSTNLIIGATHTQGLIAFLNGLVDEPEVYNRALTASEIQTIFHAGSFGKCHCVSPPSGLVSWWPGDGNAKDIVGPNDGTLVNGATFAPGKVGQAFSLNGVDQYVNVGSSATFDVLNFTIDAWVHIDPATNVGERRIISRDDAVVVPDRQLFVLKSSSPVASGGADGHAVFAILKGVALADVSAPASLTAGWHHLAGVRSGSTIALYVDGVLVATTTTSITGTISPMAPLVIGQVSPALNAEFFSGLIDEVEIFDRALTPSEIQSIFNAGSAGECRCVSPAPGLASWWPLDGNAKDIQDGNSGRVVGTGGQFVAAEVGQGFQSGGPGSLVAVNDTSSLDPAQFTIDAWAKINSLQSVGDMPIVWRGNACVVTCDVTSSYSLSIFGDPGSLSFPPGSIISGTPASGKAFFTIDNGTFDQVLVSNSTIPTGTFVHYAASIDGSTIRLYINGRLDAEASQVMTPQHSRFPFQIGSANGTSTPGFFFNGVIDELDLYNRALTPSEIQSIFNAGSAGKCKPTVTWTQLSPSVSPPARFAASMAYHVADRYVLLFGGYNHTSFLGDTWEFKAGSWTQLSPSVSPPPRQYASMTYDAADGYVLLFGGGNSGGLLGDTWEFKAGSWTQLSSSISPSPRITASMAYDPADGYVLLFGGTSVGRVDVSDTWQFKAGSWTQLSPSTSPSPRDTAPMAYDAADGHLILFGGYNLVNFLSDTWEFKAGAWTQLSPASSPSPRETSSMVYDATDAHILLFGEVNTTAAGFTILGDTWKFQSGSWTQLFPAISPSPRASSSMAFDGNDGYVLLFGGEDVIAGTSFQGDTWKFGPITTVPTKATPTISSAVTPSSITIGGSASDLATVSGGSSPTGTLTYTAYSDSACTTLVFTSASIPLGTHSGVFTPSTAGTYLWIASYSGDANNNAVSTACGATGETLTVSKATPTITTTLSPATITIGSSVTDSSTLAGFFKAGGSVTYNVYASGTTCTGVPIVFTETVPVINGIVPNSRSVVFNNTGTAQWQVVYSGDANNNPATSICGTESLTVIKSTTTTATALSSSSIIVGTSASDSASISSFFGGFSSGGSVDFDVYSGTACTGTAVFSETVTVNPATGAVPGSRAVQFNSTGIYEWQAVYSGDGNNQGSASLCGSEPLTVNKASPAITSTVTPAAITLGGSASDLASLIGGFSPSGTVTYKAYSDSACTTLVFTSANVPLGTPSSAFTPTAAGTYLWVASYNDDVNDNAVATTCGAAGETLTANTKATPTITSSVTPSSIIIGGSASDLGTLTGGSSPTGTVTYTAYSDSACTTAVFTSASIPLGTHSGVFTPSTAGTYRWIASYSGDANNNAVATTCGATAETLTVANVAPSVSTVSCGHDLSCSVLSNATLTKVKFAGITIHAEANGLKGAHGYANITVPRTAIPNIDNLHVFVDNSKLARSDVTITSNSTDYFIYFTFTFHSPVQIDIQLTAPENAPSLLLGLDPTLFYEIVGALVAVFVAIVALAVMATRRRSRASNISRQR